MIPLHADELDPSQLIAARRVLDDLDRLVARETRMYAAVRRFTRRPYRGLIEIQINDSEARILDFRVRCFAQSLSRGGISFIYPAALPTKQLTVVIPMPDGSTRSLSGRIVRTREFTAEGFWEYGVEFQAPANTELSSP